MKTNRLIDLTIIIVMVLFLWLFATIGTQVYANLAYTASKTVKIEQWLPQRTCWICVYGDAPNRVTGEIEHCLIGFGSGILYDTGVIITSAHVVDRVVEDPNTYDLRIDWGDEYYESPGVCDIVSIPDQDIAFIRTNRIAEKPLTIAFGIHRGDYILGCGTISKSEAFNRIVVYGRVSKPYQLDNVTPGCKVHVLDMACIPGMSGGAVVNKNGELVGIYHTTFHGILGTVVQAEIIPQYFDRIHWYGESEDVAK